MKLEVTTEPVKNMRGRIRYYRARFGHWEGEGPTKKEAEAGIPVEIQEVETTPYPSHCADCQRRLTFAELVYGHECAGVVFNRWPAWAVDVYVEVT